VSHAYAISPDLLNTILGAGGLAFLLALGQGIKWLLDRASAREDRVERQNDRWQRTMYRRLEYEAKQHDWFRDYAGRCESIIIRELGEKKLPPKKPYPKEPIDTDEPKAVER
jgi:hypothetical protein